MEDETPPDDVALLREALAFIGDFDGVSDDLGLSEESLGIQDDVDENDGFLWTLLVEPLEADTDTAPTTPPPQATQAFPPIPTPTTVAVPSAAKRRRIRASTKRREELAYLRETVRGLEAKLTEIKRQTNEQSREKLNVAGVNSDSMVLVQTAWEQIAMRQSKQRERAEMENIALKRLLEDQIQVGKSLERLLQRKRPKLEDTASIGRSEKRSRLNSLSTSRDTTQIFQELLSSSESQYQETPRVLASVLLLVRNMVTDRKVELVHELGMVLRTTESRILPFEYELAAQEFWQSVPVVSNSKVSEYREDVDRSDDLVQAQFRVTTNFARVVGNTVMYTVDRRFREPHRTVFISAALLDPTEISGTKLEGVYMRHTGWVVFEPIVTASGRAATKMLSYTVSVPQVFEELEDRTHKVGTMTNFVMGSMSMELETRQQAFENRLFDLSAATS